MNLLILNTHLTYAGWSEGRLNHSRIPRCENTGLILSAPPRPFFDR